MDDHPPDWMGNGIFYLKEWGMDSTQVVRINPFLQRQREKTIHFPMDCISIAKGLLENFSLTSVELHRCEIQEDGANAIAQCLSCNKFIHDLGLSRNRFYSKGGVMIASALKINQTIRFLDLSWNSLRDSVAIALAEALLVNNSVQVLLLDKNSISNDGASAIARTLSSNNKLKYLSLSENQIMAAGCGVIGDGVRHNTSLVTLDISMNAIATEGIFSLCNALTKGATTGMVLQTLNLAYNKVDTSIVMLANFVKQSSTLRELNLEYTYQVPGAELEQFAHSLACSTSLCNLSFAGNELKDAGVKTLCSGMEKMPSLRYLDFTDVGCTKDSLPVIVEFCEKAKHLHTLHLSLNRIDGENTGKHLAALASHLTFLGLNFAQLSPETIAAFSAAVQGVKNLKLESLSVRGNKFGDLGYFNLQPFLMASSQLRYLDLASNELTKAVLEKMNDIFTSNERLPYIVIEDRTVVNAETVYLPWDTITNENLPASIDMPLPPLTNCPMTINQTYAPSAGFSTYSCICGSVMKRQLENDDTAHVAGFQYAGKPVRRWEAYMGVKSGVTANLQGRKANFTYPVTVEETIKMENNIGGLVLSDDQMRREFNRLDSNGNGYLEKNEFKNIYRSFENFGMEYTDAELDRYLSKYSTADGRISYDEFCVIMLKFAQS